MSDYSDGTRALLVDASLYVFRAWHSIPPDITDAHGEPVNAVHGFLRFLLDLLERQRPVRIAVAFDISLESSFRNEIYPAYKANREPAPPELQYQFKQCMALCQALGLCTLADATFEADDLIGSALTRLRTQGIAGTLVSADKDLSQLLGAHDEQWDYARDQRWRRDGVPARYGVHAHQIADLLGLAGDTSDNIPGVPGIGNKTAAALLAHFDDLDTLLARLSEVPFLRIRGARAAAERIDAHRAQALLSRALATIRCDAPLAPDFDARRKPADLDALDTLCTGLRIGPLTRRRISQIHTPRG